MATLGSSIEAPPLAAPRVAAEPSADAYPRASAAWGFVAILMVASLIAYLDRQILNLLVDPIKRDLAVSDSQISVLQGIGFAIFYSIAGLWIGSLVDRRNRRNIVAIGIVVWSAMTMFCGLAESYAMLFVGRIGVAAGEACLVPAAYSLLADLFHPHRRGRAAGVFGTGMALGNGLSMLVGGILLALLDPPTIAAFPAIVPHVQWRLVFLLIGALGLPVALLVRSAREPARLGRAAGAAPVPMSAAFRFIRRHLAAFLTLFGAPSITMTASAGLLAWGPSMLIREFGETPAQAGFSFGLALLSGGVLGPLVMGWLSDRFLIAGWTAPRMRLYLVASPAMAVGVALIALAPSVAVSLAGTFIVFMCVHGYSMLLFAATQECSPSAVRGRILAMSSIFTNVTGLAFGPVILAFASDSPLFEGMKLSTVYGIVGVPLVLIGMLVAILSFGPVERIRAEVAA